MRLPSALTGTPTTEVSTEASVVGLLALIGLGAAARYPDRVHRSLARPRTALVGLALSSLLAAGCSEAEVPTAASRTPEARAAAVNLQLTDLPEGYEAVPIEDDGNDEGVSIETCVDAADETARLGSATSPTFGLTTNASLRFIVSRSSVFTTPDQGERLLASIQEPSALECLSERLGDGYTRLLPDLTVETALVLTPGPDLSDLGEASVALSGRATFRNESAPGPITLATSLVVIQTGDTLSALLFGGLFDAVPPETIQSLAAIVAERQAGT